MGLPLQNRLNFKLRTKFHQCFRHQFRHGCRDVGAELLTLFAGKLALWGREMIADDIDGAIAATRAARAQVRTFLPLIAVMLDRLAQGGCDGTSWIWITQVFPDHEFARLD